MTMLIGPNINNLLQEMPIPRKIYTWTNAFVDNNDKSLFKNFKIVTLFLTFYATQ